MGCVLPPLFSRSLLVALLSLALAGFTAAAPEPGFRPLYNGHDLTGWCYAGSALFDGQAASLDRRYEVKDGIFTVNPPPEGERKIQQIWTAEQFARDFTLRVEFRASVGADSGIFLRGKQLQCRDYLVAGPYKELKKYKAQDWNQIEVVVQNNVAVCTCNGEVLEAAFAIPESGPIGLEGDKGTMEYRNLEIKVAP